MPNAKEFKRVAAASSCFISRLALFVSFSTPVHSNTEQALTEPIKASLASTFSVRADIFILEETEVQQ